MSTVNPDYNSTRLSTMQSVKLTVFYSFVILYFIIAVVIECKRTRSAPPNVDNILSIERRTDEALSSVQAEE